MNLTEDANLKILMISPTSYGPENDNGTKKILFNIFKRNSGWSVDYISLESAVVDDEFDNVKLFYMKSKNFNFINPVTQPWFFRKYDIKMISRKINELLEVKEYDKIIVVTGGLSPVIKNISKSYKEKTVLLAIDSMSLFWRRRFEKEVQMKKHLYWVQSKLWENVENIFYGLYKQVIFVSNVDKMYCEKIIKKNNCISIENGVDIELFKDNGLIQEEPYSIIFTGNMNYMPNEKAVEFLLEKIYPALNKIQSKTKLYIVGIGSNKFKKKYNLKNVIFQDYVKDIVPFLAKAQVYVSPLMHGAGIKNKILEAMAMGKLIVGSPISFDGINDLNDNVYVANSVEDYLNAICQCFDLDEVKKQKKKQILVDLIASNYSWDIVAKKYDRIFSR